MDMFTEKYLKARKQYILEDFQSLNPDQQEAVMATEGPLLILAGAGSGKTTVLINRIANLLKYGRATDSSELPPYANESTFADMIAKNENADHAAALEPVDPWRILAITFTNKAAGELRDRLRAKLGEAADDIWACTFHSCCVRMLRRDADCLGYPSNFSIYDTSDSVSVIKKIIKDIGLDEKSFVPKAVLGEISRAKDEYLSADEYGKRARTSSDFRKVKIADIYREYTKVLFTNAAMDFDDLIFNTVKILNTFPDRLAYWQNKFKYIVIDEYQDTNHLQYMLASLLSGGWGNICVVGDDDQSIYKFRGANIENILSFEGQFENCRTIRLEQNYRSTERILNAANAVIANNRGRKGKTLWTDNGVGDPITLYFADNENDEARFVANSIVKSFGEGCNWRDNAVLYRMNAQSNQFEYAFKRSGIPYRIIGGTRFFDRAEVKDILAYLNVISFTGDDLRLERIINVPARGIGAKSVETAAMLAQDEGISLFEVVRRADEYPELSRASMKMRLFAQLIDELRAFSENNTPDFLLDELLEKTGYLAALEQKHTPEDDSRAENVREIKTSIISYMNESGDNSLSGFLADVALYSDIDNYDKESDSVVLMTMHSAKGLEFPSVFMCGMEETVFPGQRSFGEPEEMEEERRLCYVGITRAKKNLTLTCARQRMLFGRTTANKISRFVEEIPDEYLDKRNVPKSNRYTSYRDTGYTAMPKSSIPASKYSVQPGKTKQAQPQTPAAFAVGDEIIHKAFGHGVITKMTPMGGDYLIEILFDNSNTKKLMLRAAALFMKKV